MSKNKHNNKCMRTKRKDIDQISILEPNNEDDNATEVSKLKRKRHDDANTINSSIINDAIPIVENGITGSIENIRFNHIYEAGSGNNNSSSSLSPSNNGKYNINYKKFLENNEQ